MFLGGRKPHDSVVRANSKLTDCEEVATGTGIAESNISDSLCGVYFILLTSFAIYTSEAPSTLLPPMIVAAGTTLNAHATSNRGPENRQNLEIAFALMMIIDKRMHKT